MNSQSTCPATRLAVAKLGFDSFAFGLQFREDLRHVHFAFSPHPRQPARSGVIIFVSPNGVMARIAPGHALLA